MKNLKKVIHSNLLGLFLRINYTYIVFAMWSFGVLTSCNTLEKASLHGLKSGYYKLKSDNTNVQNVYLDVTDEKIDAYKDIKGQADKKQFLTIPLNTTTDSLTFNKLLFKKQSLDIDITSIFFKYRPSVYGLPAQFTADLNIALYVGWRYDFYPIMRKKDPLGRSYHKINNRGFDFGIFAGPGTTIINPFTTQNKRTDEYSGMIIQTGVAGFIESNVASFGLTIGCDYLLNSDRKIWIYNNKPWAGFIVGIALN